MKLSSVTWQTILISTILSGYVPAYKVQSWISSHIRKSTMDMFPQRELSKKGKWKLSFDSYEFLSKQLVCGNKSSCSVIIGLDFPFRSIQAKLR